MDEEQDNLIVTKLENGSWIETDLSVEYLEESTQYQVLIPSGFKGIILVRNIPPEPESGALYTDYNDLDPEQVSAWDNFSNMIATEGSSYLTNEQERVGDIGYVTAAGTYIIDIVNVVAVLFLGSEDTVVQRIESDGPSFVVPGSGCIAYVVIKADPQLTLNKTEWNLDNDLDIMTYTRLGDGEITVTYIGEGEEPSGIYPLVSDDHITFSCQHGNSTGTFVYRVSVAETDEYLSAYVDITITTLDSTHDEDLTD